MKDAPKSSKEIAVDALLDIRDYINEFVDEFQKKTGDTNDFITMDEIEGLFSKLDSKTRETYLTMLSDSLSNIDERPLIKSKKEN